MNLKFSDGAKRESKTRYRSSGAMPNAGSLQANIGETLASITLRAYGANTPDNRRKIREANASLTGIIRVPK